MEITRETEFFLRKILEKFPTMDGIGAKKEGRTYLRPNTGT